MIPQVSLVISLVCLVFYLCGVLVTIRNDEPNLCRMTYMYEYPQFTRISFRDNAAFPKYALYGYSEGHLTENARRNAWTGAPVLFIPGNSGSFKQARSLASVALRKGIANHWNAHLDYFAVDLNEEYSALYGGVLEEQTEFVARCVVQVLELYRGLKNRPRQLVVVGHSIGGKIAQALLLHPEVAGAINTIITLASPMDRPAINLDMHIHKFYRNVNEQWQMNRSNRSQMATLTVTEETKALDDKLLITIGGGSRDVLVHAGLTASPFSDVHAEATSIPNVWLSTDHRCSAWCKELVLVVNRFLYGILQPVHKSLVHGEGHQFVAEKRMRLERAKQLFKDERIDQAASNRDNPRQLNMVVNDRIGNWIEDTRRVYSVSLPHGLNKSRIQMIRLMDFPQYRYLNVEAVNVSDEEQFVLGCAANDVLDLQRFCTSATVISQNLTRLPSREGERYYLHLDLHRVKAENPTWTHVLLRILPTAKPVVLNVDVNEGSDRHIVVQMPKWYSFGQQVVVEDTVLGSSIYSLEIHGLDMAHQSLSLDLRRKRCATGRYHAVGRMSVPWAEGHDKYHYFTSDLLGSPPMDLTVPMNKPGNLNGSENAVQVRLHLDPSCRYQVVIRNSFLGTMARIVQGYSVWLPAHLVVVLCLALRHQLQLTPKGSAFKCYPVHKALANCGPFFIISAARLFVKMILMARRVLPVPGDYNHSLMVSVVIHGAAIALLTLAVGGLWAALVFCGNVSYRVMFRVIRLPLPTLNVWLPLVEKLPMAVAVGLISMAVMMNGGLALIVSCWVYFVLLTKMYEDYLEEWVYHTAQEIATKLFGRLAGLARRRKRRQPRMRRTDGAGGLDKEMEALLEHEKELLVGTEVVADEGDETETEEQKSERELNRLLSESIAKQKKAAEQKNAEELKQREEYNGISEGLSPLHFHFTLFLLLVTMTLLNLPSAITWARNFEHAQTVVDASTVPACMTIAALAVLWQMGTPRALAKGYQVMAMVVYGMAIVTIIYCLESPFLLNNIIATLFVLVALQQVFAPKMVIKGMVEVEEGEGDEVEEGEEKRNEIIEEDEDEGEVEEEDGEEEESRDD